MRLEIIATVALLTLFVVYYGAQYSVSSITRALFGTPRSWYACS